MVVLKPKKPQVKRSTKRAKVLKAIKEHPLESSLSLSKKTGVSHVTIGKIRKETRVIITKETIKLGIIDFIKRFLAAEKRLENMDQELEDLKVKTKIIFKIGKKGKKYPEEVPLDPMDILAIIKEQRQNQLDLLFMVSKPKVILSLENAQEMEQVRNDSHVE